MTGHEVLGLDHRKVTYENGTTIYINYSETEAVLEGVTVPGKNYVIVSQGANAYGSGSEVAKVQKPDKAE